MYFGGGGVRMPQYNTPALEMYFKGGGVVFGVLTCTWLLCRPRAHAAGILP